jgi:hypothetical protein
MNFIGLDIHKKTISYCVKDVSGKVLSEGKINATRQGLNEWMATLPKRWTVAMEATMFTGWIYDYLRPHAAAVKVAHPLMLRAIPWRRRRTIAWMPVRSPTACAVTSCLSATWHPWRFGSVVALCATASCWSGRTSS